MKASMSIDGKSRATVRIEHRVDQATVAAALALHTDSDYEREPPTTRSQAERVVRAVLHDKGADLLIAAWDASEESQERAGLLTKQLFDDLD